MAFATVVQLRPGGLVIVPDPFFTNRCERLAALALRHAIPTIFHYPEFTAAGGLMSYGSNLRDLLRWSGLYTGRILKGEKPADLPVQQATKVELIIKQDCEGARPRSADVDSGARRRGDRIDCLPCCDCSQPVLARNGRSMCAGECLFLVEKRSCNGHHRKERF
jgi:hypothetical protein